MKPSLHIVKPKKKGSVRARGIAPKAMRSGSVSEKRSLQQLKRLAKPAVDRKRAAMKRLGVTLAEEKAAPDISSLIKLGRGGLTGALEAMRFSGNAEVQQFLQKHDAIPERDRKSLSWEAIAIAADLDHAQLLGAAILAIQSHSSNAVKIIALSHHPEITQKRIEFGKQAGGEKDRTAIDTALRFLPSQKGSTIIFNANGKSRDEDDDGDETPDQDAELEYVFPSLSATQEALVPLKSRLLESGDA